MIYYLSFVDHDKPEESRWIGGCYVQAKDEADALSVSHLRACNPGGEVLLIQVPEGATIKPSFMDRLLSLSEIEDAFVRHSEVVKGECWEKA